MRQQSTDVFEQFSRRSLIATLIIVLSLGVVGIALAVSPYGEWQRTVSWMVPIAIVLTGASLRATLRGQNWDPRSDEVRRVMTDEWRRANMDRATRYAFATTLVAIWPVSLLFGYLSELPTPRAAIAIAAATMTVAITTLLASFLILDRE